MALSVDTYTKLRYVISTVFWYCNDGDWVESLTALVEDEVGELHLVDWHEIMLRWEQRQFAKKETILSTASA
jgi:hypothetical protein